MAGLYREAALPSYTASYIVGVGIALSEKLGICQTATWVKKQNLSRDLNHGCPSGIGKVWKTAQSSPFKEIGIGKTARYLKANQVEEEANIWTELGPWVKTWISAHEKEEFLNSSKFLSGIRRLWELSNVPGRAQLALAVLRQCQCQRISTLGIGRNWWDRSFHYVYNPILCLHIFYPSEVEGLSLLDQFTSHWSCQNGWITCRNRGLNFRILGLSRGTWDSLPWTLGSMCSGKTLAGWVHGG